MVMSVFAWKLVIFSAATLFHETFGYRHLVSGTTEANQSSTYEECGASRAIDGKSERSVASGSCSHTGTQQSEAWLLINLKKVYAINTIEIWYRNDRGSDLQNTERLHNYSLQYWANEWIECYRDKTPVNESIPIPSTVQCRQRTQYIKVYTNTPSPNDKYVFLEICEVKVLGCDVNQYGDSCINCSRDCDECDNVNGCIKCKPRFSGKNCESCISKWYGDGCSRKCSDKCLNNEDCNKVNGSCPRGCMPGYRGDICTQNCSDGTYGLQCKNTCDTCVNMSCNYITGSCNFGCVNGWTGDMCMKECSNGTYGFQCKRTCDTCVNLSCDHRTGSCDVGCIDGWTGNMCMKVCPEGRFGHNCSRQCKNCENETCHHVTGSCQGFCKEGWKGDRCEEAYGIDAKTFTLYFISGTGGCSTMLIIFMIVVIVTRKRQRERPSNFNFVLPLELEDHGSVYTLPNYENFDSGNDATNPTEDRKQDDINEESIYYNINVPVTNVYVDSFGSGKTHLDNTMASKKMNKRKDFQKQRPGLQARKKTNCLDDGEDANPKTVKKPRRILRDQKMSVSNVYSTSPTENQQQTADTEESIYCNTESTNCNMEESLYYNTWEASDRSSDSSGYIQITWLIN